MQGVVLYRSALVCVGLGSKDMLHINALMAPSSCDRVRLAQGFLGFFSQTIKVHMEMLLLLVYNFTPGLLQLHILFSF